MAGWLAAWWDGWGLFVDSAHSPIASSLGNYLALHVDFSAKISNTNVALWFTTAETPKMLF